LRIRVLKEEIKKELWLQKKQIRKKDKFGFRTSCTTDFTPLAPRAPHPIS